MGLFRKMTSISTLGMVDFQSDKERMARSARLTKQAVREQNRLMAEQNAILRRQAAQHTVPRVASPTVPTQIPAGWYADPAGLPVNRWWDGQRWTESTAPKA